MKKLFVAGCSFSDYTKVEHAYGEILAGKLNYQYVHEGAGCGSNWRIWRTITKHILDGNLTSDDLLIIQYTELTRNEFHSVLAQPKYVYEPRTIDNLPITDIRDDGFVIRYKFGADVWQNNKEESEFFKLYTKYFVNINFAEEQFLTHHHMFQHMLINNNIKTIFVASDRNHPKSFFLRQHTLPNFIPYMFSEPTDKTDCEKYNLTPGDWGHLNQKGHEVFAGWLYDHIYNNKILLDSK